MTVIHNFNRCGQVEVLPVFHHDLRRTFHSVDCSNIGHDAIHKRLCLFFQSSDAVAHVDFRPVGQVIHPVNTCGRHQLVVILLNSIRLLRHDTGSNVRDFPLQFCVCGLERHRYTLTINLFKLGIRLKDFVLDSNALSFVFLEFLGQLCASILDALISLLCADQRERVSRALLDVSLYAVQPLNDDGQLLQFDNLQCGFLCHVASSFYFPKTMVFPVSLFRSTMPFGISRTQRYAVQSQPAAERASFWRRVNFLAFKKSSPHRSC